MTFYSKLTTFAIIATLSCSSLAYAMEKEENQDGDHAFIHSNSNNIDRETRDTWLREHMGEKEFHAAMELEKMGALGKMHNILMEKPKMPQTNSMVAKEAYSTAYMAWVKKHNDVMASIGEDLRAFYANPQNLASRFKIQRPERRHSF